MRTKHEQNAVTATYIGDCFQLYSNLSHSNTKRKQIISMVILKSNTFTLIEDRRKLAAISQTLD